MTLGHSNQNSNALKLVDWLEAEKKGPLESHQAEIGAKAQLERPTVSQKDIAAAVLSLAEAAAKVARQIRKAATAGNLAAVEGQQNADGDAQKGLDLYADAAFLDAARAAPISVYASEEQDGAKLLNDAHPLVLAIDPLDGSSNIEFNVTIGAIFSLMPRKPNAAPLENVLQAGRMQCGAGFFLFGPQTWLVISVGGAVALFAHDVETQNWLCLNERLAIPKTCTNYAINASNRLNWQGEIRAYIADCESGKAGPCGKTYNMRWVASLVADACRTLLRGGIFLYPADSRKGYERGRLRLVYEANPISYIVEKAGGAALSTPDAEKDHSAEGKQGKICSILDLVPDSIHARTPLVFGSAQEVERLKGYFS